MLKRMKIKVAPPKPLSEIMIPKALAYVCFLLFIASNFTSQLATLPSWATELILIGGVLGALVLVFFGYICCLVYGAVRYHKNVALFVILITFLMRRSCCRCWRSSASCMSLPICGRKF